MISRVYPAHLSTESGFSTSQALESAQNHSLLEYWMRGERNCGQGHPTGFRACGGALSGWLRHTPRIFLQSTQNAVTSPS